jgi:hypothetical protein
MEFLTVELDRLVVVSNDQGHMDNRLSHIRSPSLISKCAGGNAFAKAARASRIERQRRRSAACSGARTISCTRWLMVLFAHWAIPSLHLPDEPKIWAPGDKVTGEALPATRRVCGDIGG